MIRMIRRTSPIQHFWSGPETAFLNRRQCITSKSQFAQHYKTNRPITETSQPHDSFYLLPQAKSIRSEARKGQTLDQNMTKRFAILQNKIDELESELLDLAHHNPDRQPDSQDIEQRFVFLRTLLSTEVASSPAKPHHLQHIDKRLTELEAAFHNWDEFRTNLDDDDDDDDMVSKCSCTESCLNEDGETQACSFDELGSAFFHEPHHVVDELLPAEKAPPPPPPPTLPETEGKAVHQKSEGKEVGVRKVCGAVSCGVVIGIVFMGLVVVRMCDCLTCIKHSACPVPT